MRRIFLQKKMSRIFFFSLQSRAVTQTSLARTSCRIEIDAGNKTPEFFFFSFSFEPAENQGRNGPDGSAPGAEEEKTRFRSRVILHVHCVRLVVKVISRLILSTVANLSSSFNINLFFFLYFYLLLKFQNPCC